MIIEVVALLTVLLGGCALCRVVGVVGWALPAVGFVAGTALQVLIGTVQIVVGAPTTPILTLALTVTLPVAVWVLALRRGQHVGVRPRSALLTGVAVMSGVLAARVLGAVSVTPDSFRYATVGSLLASQRLHHAQPFTLETRLVAVPIVHAPANLVDQFYLVTATPALAAATVGVLIWLSREGLAGAGLPGRLTTVAAWSGAALLVTNSRFLFHATYLNGHVLFAALLLVAVGCAWLSAVTWPDRRRFAAPLQALTLAALVVVRPEGAVVAGLALLPVLLDGRRPRSARLGPAAALGFSMLVWHGYVVARYLADDTGPPSSAVALATGGAVLVVGSMVTWRRLGDVPRVVLPIVEIGLWAALAVATLGEPRILARSAFATLRNVALDEGGWGVSLLFLGAMVVGVLVLTSAAERVFLRFPLTTFIPLAALLPYLRGGPYRAGPGDSLNRTLLHVVPLAVLLLVSGVASSRSARDRHLAPADQGSAPSFR